MRKAFLLAALASLSLPAGAGNMEDNPTLVMLRLNQFEWRVADGDDTLVWDAQGWIGRDLNKLWMKTEGEYADDGFDEAEVQLLYSRAVTRYWDIQLGWRGDIRPQPDRNWLAFGFQGLAPYFFESDIAFFVGDNGRTAARMEFEYELLFTQRLILTPEIELNFYGKDDPEVGVGSGLSELEAGLRLRYEIRREFAPYLGVNWWGVYGDTADFTRAAGGTTRDTRFLIGIRAWF